MNDIRIRLSPMERDILDAIAKTRGMTAEEAIAEMLEAEPRLTAAGIIARDADGNLILGPNVTVEIIQDWLGTYGKPRR